MCLKSTFIGILVLLLCSALTASDKLIEVTVSRERITSTPKRDGEVVGYTAFGFRYPVLIEYDDWIKIKFEDKRGWVPRTSIKYVTDPLVTKPETTGQTAVSTEKKKASVTTGILRWLAGETNLGTSDVSDDPAIKKYVHITNPFATVYQTPALRSAVLGKARQGQSFLYLDSVAEMYHITFRDTVNGWVLTKHAVLEDDPSAYMDRIFRRYRNISLTLLLIGLTIFLAVRLLTIRRVRRIRLKKSLIILCTEDKAVQHTLTKENLTLEKCVAQIGFTVFTVKTVAMADNRIVHFMPDGILVDWQISPNIAMAIQRTLLARTSTSNIPVIFYNVPDTDHNRQQLQLASVHYLGVAFTDWDLLALVTPLLVSGKKAMVQNSIQSSAIQGDIGDGNLSAIFQLMEISSKTGSLLISDKDPIGMVAFDKGRIIFSAIAGKTGMEAVLSLLDLKKGEFRFIADKMPPSQNCNHSTLEVLMEWAKRHDETNVH